MTPEHTASTSLKYKQNIPNEDQGSLCVKDNPSFASSINILIIACSVIVNILLVVSSNIVLFSSLCCFDESPWDQTYSGVQRKRKNVLSHLGVFIERLITLLEVSNR